MILSPSNRRTMGTSYICNGVRTPIGRYNEALIRIGSDDLAGLSLNAFLKRHDGLDRDAIDDVILGYAKQADKDNRNVARMVLLRDGLPRLEAAETVSRFCASGLEAV